MATFRVPTPPLPPLATPHATEPPVQQGDTDPRIGRLGQRVVLFFFLLIAIPFAGLSTYHIVRQACFPSRIDLTQLSPSCAGELARRWQTLDQATQHLLPLVPTGEEAYEHFVAALEGEGEVSTRRGPRGCAATPQDRAAMDALTRLRKARALWAERYVRTVRSLRDRMPHL